MYNIDFLPQIEISRKHIFGNLDPRNLPASSRYSPPNGIKIIECEEDINEEWVPKKALEEKV